MRVSQQGREFIASFEGEILKVYLDPIGLPTVGVGHLVKPSEKSKYPVGKKITKAESQALLSEDLKEFEDGVSALLQNLPNQNEFDALVSLAFNIGLANFKKSSVLKHFNSNRLQQAATAFLAWNKAKNKKGQLVALPGLTRRRRAERDLFLSFPGATQASATTPSEAESPILAHQEAKTQAPGFFGSTMDRLAGVKAKFDAIGVDPTSISKPSWFAIIWQKLWAAILAVAAYYWDNPWVLLGTVALLIVGGVLYNNSRKRAREAAKA